MKPRFRIHVFTIILAALCWSVGADDAVTEQDGDPEPSGLALELGREPLTVRWQTAKPAVLASAIRAGDAGARLEWVRRHESGEGVPRNHDQALRLLRDAAEGGDRPAQYWLGHYHADEEPAPGNNTFVGNYQLAAEWLEAAARQGHTIAAFELGELYHFGKLPRDDGEAIRWFKQAAEADHAEAAANLAFHLAQGGETATGEAVRARPDDAIRWYQTAVDRGFDNAAVALADFLSGDFRVRDHHQPAAPDIARKWLLKAAARGHIRSKAVLAIRFRDFSTLRATDALELEDTVRRGGSPEASQLLGQLYEEGRWLQKDLRRALECYQRAGPWGSEPNGELQLAFLRCLTLNQPNPGESHAGDLFPTNPAWAPSPTVRLQIAEMLWNGNQTVPRDRALALEWFLLAAQAGSSEAMRRIGQFWAEGVNGQPDPDEARRWFRRAEVMERTTQPSAQLPLKSTNPNP